MARQKPMLPWMTVRALMRSANAPVVERRAVDLVIESAAKYIKSLTEQSVAFARHARRKKVTIGDVRLALQYVDPPTER